MSQPFFDGFTEERIDVGAVTLRVRHRGSSGAGISSGDTGVDVGGGMLEDYRAGLGPDRAADVADQAAGRRIECPTMVLWSTRDDLADLYGDVLAVWRPWAGDLRGGPIESGHHMAEDAPEELSAQLIDFLTESERADR